MFFNEKNSSRTEWKIKLQRKDHMDHIVFQDSGNSTNLSEFSGKKAFFWIGTRSSRMISVKSWVWGLGVALENTASLKIDSQ